MESFTLKIKEWKSWSQTKHRAWIIPPLLLEPKLKIEYKLWLTRINITKAPDFLILRRKYPFITKLAYFNHQTILSRYIMGRNQLEINMILILKTRRSINWIQLFQKKRQINYKWNPKLRKSKNNKMS